MTDRGEIADTGQTARLTFKYTCLAPDVHGFITYIMTS